jgi:hypothetical protein
MGRIKPAIYFFIFWFALQTLLGQWQNMAKPPQGMHQGAQADRACIAWNYYHESMNFFEPRVMENRSQDGIAGLEFPIVYYTAAVFYKLFGFHDFWFRLIVFLIVTFGVFAAWGITGFFIQKNLHRLLLTFGWYLSPVMVFYSANFIPDPVALSFSFVAWYFFLRFYFNIQVKQSLRFYLLFTALTGLIKITFLISHFSILFLFLIYHYRSHYFPLGFPKIKYFWGWFILPVIPVMAWYGYAKWLTDKTGNMHFLQQMNPAKNWDIFKDNTRFGFNTWQDSIYAPNHIYVILGLIVLFLFLRWKQAPIPAMITTLLLLGFIASFVLFNNQYRYHDYYYILLFPGLFFGMIFLQQLFLEQKSMFVGLFSILFLIGFFYLPFTGFSHSKNMLAERYRAGSYYSQEVFTGIRQYTEFQKNIENKIPMASQVVSVFDPSPNTSLYYLRKKGIRIAPDFSPELTRDIMRDSKADYMVLNDSLLWESTYEPIVKTNKKLIYRKGILSLWKLDDNTKNK